MASVNHPSTVTAPNGDTFLIRPKTPALISEAVNALAKRGIKVSAVNPTLQEVLALRAEQAKLVTVEWKPAGSEAAASPKEIEQLFQTSEGAARFVERESDRLAKEADAAWGVEEGN